MNVRMVILSAAAWTLLSGCSGRGWGENPADFVKPTIAVMKFENRAPFPLGWNLGDGMRDILVDRLVATGRYTVVERPEIAAVLRELRFQHSGATRAQRRAAAGRLKNVQYLIKGTVTDFGHVSTSSGFARALGWDVLTGKARAVMGMTLYVVDVESGEIIASESIEESVRANDLAVRATYKGVAFGGRTFYRTPLGRATARVIDKAVRRITRVIAARPWEPKIALVQAQGSVILNGGRDRRVQVGDEFEVCAEGAAIIDPDTGDEIGRHPGRTLGRIRVVRVEPRYSVAEVVAGKAEEFAVGARCRRVAALAAK